MFTSMPPPIIWPPIALVIEFDAGADASHQDGQAGDVDRAAIVDAAGDGAAAGDHDAGLGVDRAGIVDAAGNRGWAGVGGVLYPGWDMLSSRVAERMPTPLVALIVPLTALVMPLETVAPSRAMPA